MLVVLAGCSNQTSAPTPQTQPTATISPSPSASGTAVVTPAPTTPVATSSSKVTASTAPATTQKSEVKTFSASELAKYDGQNGTPAYVAVNGKVYDVTNVKGWRNGQHEGASAGKDLTKETMNSPHGLSALEGVPVVGVYGG